MTVVELVRLFAEPLDTAVVLTDVDLERPGPTVLYVNPAFTGMSGYAGSAVVGKSPRLLQGAGTRRELTRLVTRRLRAEGRFHGVLENYRSSGAVYLCELDVRALNGTDGRPLAFIAFEREVVRRKGRPSGDGAGRYTPVVRDPTVMAPLSLKPSIFG
ncbi:PAS domain-containing protein [Methylobacterium sp. J-070]|uniref:PAS domain-containing protein n=1 Tax=Methylobacterium sp. J-070 TaxID=2836650 RepID=UPI001FB979CB|nr:PAS domain S-box protein [Methylobacterium sp. J-070]MCJ2051837.1 PAS domain S-box protein [Methylobacterium sp. J-070]